MEGLFFGCVNHPTLQYVAHDLMFDVLHGSFPDTQGSFPDTDIEYIAHNISELHNIACDNVLDAL